MEDNLKKCPKCGWEIARAATLCPNCNYNFLEPTQVKRQKLSQTSAGIVGMILGLLACLLSCTSIGAPLAIFGIIFSCVGLAKKYYAHGTAVAGLTTSVIAVVIALIVGASPDGSGKDKKDTYVAEATETPKDASKDKKSNENVNEPTATPNNKKDWEKTYENSDIQYVNLKFLAKNAKYYKGQVVISVSEIYEVNDDNLQFDTDDSNFFKEVTCKFKNKSEISGLNEKEKVCFIGKVSDVNTYLGNDTVTLKKCFLVSKGKAVSEYQKKIKNNVDEQKKYISDAKSNAKKAKKKAAENEKSSYIKKCKTYSYKNIQRHPDRYEGKKIKVSGTVIQVMEGWFDAVSLRVEDSSGNIWYIDYSYSDNEAKILENDKITVYGESTGTETYTTILGSSQTIPSIDAKYIK